MMKIVQGLLIIFLSGVLLSGCSDGKGSSAEGISENTQAASIGTSAKYKDGVVEEKITLNGDAYSTIKITIEGGKITAVDWKEYDGDGKLKDDNYGKDITDAHEAERAQAASPAFKSYPERLLEVQDWKKVDVISGATNSHLLFRAIVKKALEKASAN